MGEDPQSYLAALTDDIIIETDVPLPREKRGRRGWMRSYFERMEIGHSFVLPYGSRRPLDVQQGLGAAARRYGLPIGQRFVTSQESQGVRIWRVK